MTLDMSRNIRISNSPYVQTKKTDSKEKTKSTSNTKYQTSNIDKKSTPNISSTVKSSTSKNRASLFTFSNQSNSSQSKEVNKTIKKQEAIKTYANYLREIRADRIKTRFDLLL